MKKANEFLNELKETFKFCEKVHQNKVFVTHPAKELDEYMKEQYFVLLSSILIYGESQNKKALSYIINLSKIIGYKITPEEMVKYVFAFNDSKKNDCAVSFRDEEIKYLLGFEMHSVFSYMNENTSENYLKEVYKLLEISDSDYEDFKMIFNVINENNLNLYTAKKCYRHTKILNFYLNNFNFTKERCVVISNCLKEVRESGYDKSNNSMPVAYFSEGRFLSDYECGTQSYVEKGTSLGHFIVRVGGKVSFNPFVSDFTKRWNQQEELEKRLITPKFKKYNWMRTAFDGGYYDDNTYEVCDIKAEKSGVFHFIYNCIGEYNDPFAIISHPLDDEEKICEYLNEQIKISRNKKGDST